MAYLWRVLKYVRPYSRLATISLIVLAASGLAGLLAPWPMKVLVDNVLGSEPLPGWLARMLGPLGSSKTSLLIAAVCGGLGLVLVENGLNVVGQYVNTRLEQRMILDFRSDLFQHAQKLSMAYHDRHQSGGMIYAINFQADAAAGLVMAIPPLAHSALTLVGMFFIWVLIDWRLALLSITVVPFLYYSVNYYATHIQDRLMKVKELEGQSLSIIHEAVSMFRVILAFGREPYEHGRFREQGKAAVEARVKVTVRQTLFSMIVNTLTGTGTALVLGYGAMRGLQGKLTVGQLWVVVAYLTAIYKPLEAISYTIGSLQERFASLRVAFKLLDEKPDIDDAPGAVAISRSRGQVEFEDVGFQYARRVDTLRNVSFKAEPGQAIAVVGPTGAGKSTLVSLLPRFYDPRSGRILIDGFDTRQIQLRSLREQISIVLQEPALFSGSIAYNIRYGRLDATDEQVMEAARAANAHDFIMGLPRKYETELGERGAQLSGGERQRIAVARAFLKDAPILILDEPTSAVDSRTEAVILDALDRLMAGRTTFIIAHRLSTIRRADLILVMDKGRIVETGGHDELFGRRGLYRQMFDLQSADPVETGPADAERTRDQEARV